MSNKNLLLEYANYKLQITDLEAKMELIKGKVLEEIKTIQGDTTNPVQLKELPGYSFTIQKRKTWVYPAIVEETKKTLDALKQDSEADGSATFTEKEQLMFLSPKQ